jgi:multisubunit Na+/H+ antiporter MnhB subunit
MFRNVIEFYRGTTEWRRASRVLGSLFVLSALSLTPEGAVWAGVLGAFAIGALALGLFADDRTNKIVLISVVVIGVLVGGYFALTYEETP